MFLDFDIGLVFLDTRCGAVSFSIIIAKIAAIGVLKIGHHTYALSYITLMAK